MFLALLFDALVSESPGQSAAQLLSLPQRLLVTHYNLVLYVVLGRQNQKRKETFCSEKETSERQQHENGPLKGANK